MKNMTDIRDRLRDLEALTPNEVVESIARDAADEIERLRALLKEVTDAYEGTEYYSSELLKKAREALTGRKEDQ